MAIQQALEACGGSTAEAAQALGISRRKIQYRLREWSGESGGEGTNGGDDGGEGDDGEPPGGDER